MKHIFNIILLGVIAIGTIYCCDNNTLNNLLFVFGVNTLTPFWSATITVMLAVVIYNMLIGAKTRK